MKLKRKIQLISVALLILALPLGAETNDDKLKKLEQRNRIMFALVGGLRSHDPEVTKGVIEELFKFGGLEALMLLHFKWIEEPNPEIRKQILEGFAKIGDHRHIADPSFPKEWHDAAMRFSTPEKEQRLKEIRDYFPEELRRYVR